MSARYLVRFDDLSPTMNWTTWDPVEAALVDLDVRPLVAIVPDNRDPGLEVGPANEGFWERVRGWQARGWTIGIHGFQHRYVTGESGLIGINPRSEFAGLPREEQEEKVRAGLAIFRKHDVEPQVWVAPGHSFDSVTVGVLKDLGIRTISDGLYVYPFTAGDMFWIPQQLWRFRRMPFGVWTVCSHPNAWSPGAASSFVRDLSAFRERITDVPTIEDAYADRARSWWDGATSRIYLTMLRAKRGLGSRRPRPARVRA
jgi:predicted deacetylase